MTPYFDQQRGMFSSDRTDWETPAGLFWSLNAEFDFTLDAAASAENAKCARFFNAEQDGLAQPWAPERVWVNPPYGRRDNVGRWVHKAATEAALGALVVMLVPARTDTKWFHEIAQPNAEIRFLKGRVKFVGASSTAPFPCCVLIFRPETNRAETVARDSDEGLRPANAVLARSAATQQPEQNPVSDTLTDAGAGE